ncbi:molybdopterin molybdotransferase MoeA [Candidatus Halobeggiatoa sp. HSG11]|nr:molybdopterin molybdotransferase MoeA [Candidatus Halobeggiatoa sp. HSG11]
MQIPSNNDYDSQSLTVEEALTRIYDDLQPIAGNEQLAIRNALGRVLAEDILSKINVPPHDNSAMDGYAIQGTDLPADGQIKLTMVGTSFAGQPYPGTLQAGQCTRIFTGAVIPDGADTVIMQEHIDKQGDIITISSDNQVGQHVRPTGEDIAIGQTILKTGKYLHPADIGLLASLGIPEVKVKRRLRVAFFSTGDELRAVGEMLEAGQIYDSNRYSLYGVLARLGVDIIDMGVVLDKPEDVEQAFLAAADCSDAIITSGGVSVGDADYVTDTLQRLGKVNFWKVAMKPGKPLTFGELKGCAFFGLPGNPVSAIVTFYQFVQPALRYMMGQTNLNPVRVPAKCLSYLKKHPGRMEFQRGILTTDEQGKLLVSSTGKQGSGVLSSMSQANCFIVLPRDCGNVEVGNEVLVEPFEGLI